MLRALLAASLALASPAFAADPAPVDAGWLVQELRRGGYLVFFRHTSTYREEVDMESRNVAAGRLSLDDCATQRNLNERGVAEARKQATIVAELKIPAGKVYASNYCRARDHVRWFGADVTPNDALTPVRNAEKAKVLRALLATVPAPGTNTFFFAHGGILWQATDYDSEEAETFVFKPGDPATLVAAIKMRDWDALAAQRGLCCAPRSFWGGGPAPKE
ncbi:MAG: hypothetical protein ACHQJ7_00530 [Vicinamibacteria bacterium]